MAIKLPELERRKIKLPPEFEAETEVDEFGRLLPKSPQPEVPQFDLDTAIKAIYPEKDTQTFLNDLEQKPEEFHRDMVALGHTPVVDTLLKSLDLPEQDIADIFQEPEPEVKAQGLIGKLFPQLDVEGFVNLVETKWDEFLNRLKVGGYTKDKEDLLRLTGLPDEEISQIIPIKGYVNPEGNAWVSTEYATEEQKQTWRPTSEEGTAKPISFLENPIEWWKEQQKKYQAGAGAEPGIIASYLQRRREEAGGIERLVITPIKGINMSAEDIAGIALMAYTGFQAAQVGWDFFLRSSLARNLSSWAKSAGVELTDETKSSFINAAMANLSKKWLSQQAIKTIFNPTKVGLQATPETASQAESEVLSLVQSKAPAFLIPKGTQTGAMAFGGLPYLSQARWNAMAVPERVAFVVSKGLPGTVGSKAWEALTGDEIAKLQVEIPEVPAVPPTEAAAKGVAKEPWQMTREEWTQYALRERIIPIGIGHKPAIAKALSEGKSVPPEVLKDYPDLAKVAPVTPEVIGRNLQWRVETKTGVATVNITKEGKYQFVSPYPESKRVIFDSFDDAYNELVKLGDVKQVNMTTKTVVPFTKQAIPKAEPGMPEAGLQPSMLPEEVAAKEVRPEAKGKLVQAKMEDYAQLQDYQRQAEIEALSETIQGDKLKPLLPLWRRIQRTKDQKPDLTIKEYKDLTGSKTVSPTILSADKKHVTFPEAMDRIASEYGYETPDVLLTALNRLGENSERLVELKTGRITPTAEETEVIQTLREKPLETLPPPTPEEVAESKALGQPILTPTQVTRTLELFGKYVDSGNVLDAWELTRELRRETRAGQAELLKARAQELIVSKGVTAEEGMRQAIRETLSGELPVVPTDYLSDLTDQMRDALFVKVYQTLKDEPFEMASTLTALTNALTGTAIPREPGVKGGSAFSRLQRVFGDQPVVMKALDKIASEKKPLEKVLEGIYHEIGRDPIPIDQEMADYLRGLSTDVLYTPTVFREPIPVAKFEAPIEDAFKQKTLKGMTFLEKSTIVRVLKELGMLPVDIGNLVRANLASFDFSFWRQVKTITPAHPVAFYRANVEAWKAMLSQRSADANWTRITHDPLYQIYEEVAAKGKDFLRPLVLQKGTSQYKGVEEYGYLTGERWLTRLTEKLPWIKISARSFVTGTNTMTWLVFKNHYKAMLRYSQKIASGKIKLKVGEAFDMVKEMTDFAGMLSDFTQRGSLGKFQVAAPALSAMFFAPRSKLGRLLTPRHLVSANPRVRAEAWKDLSLFVGVIGGLVMLGDWLDLWEVEKDPRNAEVWSIRIGNLRIDPWAGNRQFAVFYARIISGTGVSSVTGAEYEVNPIGALTNFIRSSLAPFSSIILDFWTRKNFLGEKMDIANKKQWLERVLPFALQNIWETFEEGWKEGAIATLPAIVGEGVSVYTGDWKENFPKLGLPKYLENTAYGITEPKYDTADFWADTSSQFKGVDPATLTKAKGFPEYIRAIAEARIINEHLDTLPNVKLVSLNADPAKGVTFAQYRRMWLDRKAIVDSGDEEKLKAFDSDERTRNAQLGNMSQRQFALLNEYWSITDKKKQAEFLKQHEAEIGINQRQDYLRSHPLENAQLAIWEQAKILTQKAYDEAQGLIKTLDIPDSAIPPFTLPPETSIDTHFKYEEMVADGKQGSWEAQLMLKQDVLKAKDAGVKSYAEWKGLTLSDTPIASLELKVKNRKLFDTLTSYSDKDSPDYIADEKKRAEAIKKFKTDNPTFVDDTRRIEAIEKGTDKVPTPEPVIKNHIDYMKLQDKEGIGSSSAEVMLFRVDNPDYDKWRQDTAIWEDQALKPVDQSKIPGWRIDVKYRKEDAEYNAIKNPLPAEQSRLRDQYMATHEVYRKDDRRREAYALTNSKTGEKFPTSEVENYVAYNEISVKGFRQERFLIANPNFTKAMHDIKGLDLPDPKKIPAVQYDDIYDQYKDLFDELESASEERRKVLRFDQSGKYTQFGLAELKRNAYGAFVSVKYTSPDAKGNPIDDYVGYYKIIGEGKPKNWKSISGTDLPWYEDDWWMIDHPDYYKEVYLNKDIYPDHQRKDYRKVPTREVFAKYLIYLNDKVEGKPREDYRFNNSDLEDWLLLTGKVTQRITEKKRRAELTPSERLSEEVAKRLKAISELREPIKVKR